MEKLRLSVNYVDMKETLYDSYIVEGRMVELQSRP